MANRPIFGQRVRITAQAMKCHDKPRWKYPVDTTWQRVSCEEMEGIYIGWRRVSEGRSDSDNEYGEYGNLLSTNTYFTPKKYLEVWLIVTSDRTNPFRAFPEDVSFEVVEHGESK